MSFFIERSTKTVQLDDKNSITIIETMSAEEFMRIDSGIGFDTLQNGTAKIEDLIKILEIFLVDWHLLDSKDKVVPFGKDKIKRLSVQALTTLVEVIVGVIMENGGIDKKKMEELNKPFEQGEQTTKG